MVEIINYVEENRFSMEEVEQYTKQYKAIEEPEKPNELIPHKPIKERSKDYSADNTKLLTQEETDELLQRAMRARNGDKFSALYSGDISAYQSQSEADMAFCRMLAFWTNRNFIAIDQIFRQSGLYRDKWDMPNGAYTYGEITISKANASCDAVYVPVSYNQLNAIIARMRPECNPEYTWDDIGNGRLFADLMNQMACFVPEKRRWFLYFTQSKRWVEDEYEAIMAILQKVADCLLLYAKTIQDPDVREKYTKHVEKWRPRPTRERILKDAQSRAPLSINSFDTSRYLFNCQNGTLNLETGEFYAHRAEDYITLLSDVIYDPEDAQHVVA